jgi:hypothetical protein
MTDGLTVHQVSIGWTHRGPGGGSGMGALAWSCSEEAARHVIKWGRPVLWGPEADDQPALSRLVGNGDEVLVLHRVPTVDRTGRASFRSHGLVGTRAALDPEVSLGLYRWDWPDRVLTQRPTGPALSPVDSRTLRGAAMVAIDELRVRLPAVADPLTSVVAELLRRPAGQLSVLRPADPAAPPILLVGVLDLFWRRMPGAWSFTTNGVLGSDQFRIEFVPLLGTSVAAHAAARPIDPAVRVDDRAAAVADRLVRHYLDDPGDVERLGNLPSNGSALEIVEDWLGPLRARSGSTRHTDAVAARGVPPGVFPTGAPPSDAGPSGPSTGMGRPAASSGGVRGVFYQVWDLVRDGKATQDPMVRALLDGADERALIDELDHSDLPPRMRELLSRELAGRPIHETTYGSKPASHVIVERSLFADRSDSTGASAEERGNLVAALVELFDAALGPHIQGPGMPVLVADVVLALMRTPDGRLVVGELLERPEPPPMTADDWHALARSQARELTRLQDPAAAQVPAPREELVTDRSRDQSDEVILPVGTGSPSPGARRSLIRGGTALTSLAARWRSLHLAVPEAAMAAGAILAMLLGILLIMLAV